MPLAGALTARCFLASAWIVLTALRVLAFNEPKAAPLPDFDVRQPQSRAGTQPPDKAAAHSGLQSLVPGSRVDFDPVLNSPRSVRARDGFLTGPQGIGRAVSRQTTERFGATDPHRAVKAFLEEHRALFGHGAEALAVARVKRDFVTAHNGLHTVCWEQQVDGHPVFGATLIAHTTRDGELASVSSLFLPDPESAAQAGLRGKKSSRSKPGLTGREAVRLAAENVGTTIPADQLTLLEGGTDAASQKSRFTAPGLRGEAQAALAWLPLSAAELRLCWEVLLAGDARDQAYRLLLDAETGEALVRHCLTFHLTPASYRVFTGDSPTPFSPGYSTPQTNQPPVVPRSLVTLAALDTNASPRGWLEESETRTLGNNVDAFLDWDGNLLTSLIRPECGPERVFDFPFDPSWHPTNYAAAATVQLFYWCNWMHDRLYGLGFTEAAGNFQTTNYDRGGIGKDAVRARAQAYADHEWIGDNASISVLPEGAPPVLTMELWLDGEVPRDSCFDTQILLHEYTHGLSQRLVGGGAGLHSLQSAGLGEGWSDFYSLALLSEPGDDVDGCYAAGSYAGYQLGRSPRIGQPGLVENYYFGLRRYPYSTDMNKNPLVFADIDPAQFSVHPGIPRNPLSSTNAYAADEVHNIGQVWCAILWEVRAGLVRKHGFATGNELALQLVTAGMVLTPPRPNFIDARDAILLADRVKTGGANQAEMWAAFAKRGLGRSASSPYTWAVNGLVQAFDLPGSALELAPAGEHIASGPAGGPFAAPEAQYRLHCAGSNTVRWAAAATENWLSLAPANGAVAPGEPDAVLTATLLPAAAQLAAGVYTNQVWFTNLASGLAQSRRFVLRVGQNDPRLSLAAPGTVFEGDGVLPLAGAVRLSAPLPTNLVVSLGASDANRLSVPPSVTIPSGESQALFDLAAVETVAAEGQQAVTLTAHAEGLAAASMVLQVIDAQSPRVPFSPGPADRATNVPALVQLSWSGDERELIINGDFESGNLEGWTHGGPEGAGFLLNDGQRVPSQRSFPVEPFGGRYGVLTDSAGSGQWDLFQEFAIPAQAASVTLRWVQRLENVRGAFSDRQQFRVELRDTNSRPLAVLFATRPGDESFGHWETRQWDLAPFRGQRVRLAFSVQADEGYFHAYLDDISVRTVVADATTYSVYFGAAPELGPTEMLGAATNTSWPLPLLAPATTYYWRVIAQRNGIEAAGPVWQFTTAGADHFEWSGLPAFQAPGQSICATLAAKDAFGNTVSNFNGDASLSAFRRSPVETVAVLASVELGDDFTYYPFMAISEYLEDFDWQELGDNDELVLDEMNVLVIPEIEPGHNKPELLAQIGADWAPALQHFVRSGGTVLACCSFSEGHLILRHSGLLEVTKLGYEEEAPLIKVAEHPLVSDLEGVFTGYRVGSFSATQGQVLVRSAGTSNAVVIVRELGLGRVVLLGSGLMKRGDLDQVAGNAVRLAQAGRAFAVPFSVPQPLQLTNGLWSGCFKVNESSPGPDNFCLLAETSQDLAGLSEPVQITPTNQLGLTVSVLPTRISPGSNLNCTVTLFYSGPGAAPQVEAVTGLPQNARLASWQADQGVCSLTDTGLVWRLDALDASTLATLNLVFTPTNCGGFYLFWRAASSDTNIALASAWALAQVEGSPELMVKDARTVEPLNGDAMVRFEVALSRPCPLPVTVQVSTGDGTAVAPVDYAPTNFTLRFEPGVTTLAVPVRIHSDGDPETEETFFVRLANPSNATLRRSEATGTIRPPPPPVAPWTIPRGFATRVPTTTKLAWLCALGKRELLVNGGFEMGDFTGWVKTPATVFTYSGTELECGDYKISDGTGDPHDAEAGFPAYAGQFSALSSAWQPLPFRLQQEVTLPADAASAALFWMHSLRNVVQGDFTRAFRVEIRDTNDNPLATAFEAPPQDTPSGSWERYGFDLSPFRGQTVRIVFYVNPGERTQLRVHLDDVSVLVAPPASPISYDLYFGTNSVPGAAEFVGTMTNESWQPPALAPNTTYYWQVLTRIGSQPLVANPVWQFTTWGLDHFDWSFVSSPQLVARPFSVMVSAKDPLGTTITNFSGPVNLTALEVRSNAVAFSDDFENGNAQGWSFYGSNVLPVVTDTAASGTHSVRLSHAAWDVHTLIRSLPELKASRISFFVRASVTNQPGIILLTGPTNSLMAGILQFSVRYDGLMGLSHPQTHQDYLTNYLANRWHKIDLRLDWPRETIEYRVDDALVSANIPFGVSGSSGIPQLYFEAGSTNSLWLDNLGIEATVPVNVAFGPTNRVVFHDGCWQGDLVVHEPAGALFLQADDGLGHTNSTSAFAVEDPADLNANGLPDSWERRHFGALNTPAGAPAADPDGDGVNNLEEYRAGTTPCDAASVLRFTSTPVYGGRFHLRFTAVSGKTYCVERAGSLLNPVWQTVADNILGAGVTVDVSDVFEGQTQFYRIRQRGPP